MPKFRDLVKNILYEDVEEDETEEESQPVSQPAEPRIPPVQPAVTETIVAREPAKTTLFGELSMDAIAQPDGTAPAKSPRPRKTYAERRTGPNREYQAVLSPIFGNMDEDQKDLTSVHDAINLSKPNEEMDLVRVISPIYGTQIQQPTPPAAPKPPEVQEPQEEMETMDLKTFLAKKPGKAS